MSPLTRPTQQDEQKEQSDDEEWRRALSRSVKNAWSPDRILLQCAWRKSLQVLQRCERRHRELHVSGGEDIEDAWLKVNVFDLQSLPASGGGTLKQVDATHAARLQLSIAAPLTLSSAQHVCVNELAAWAAVQAELQAAAFLHHLFRNADGKSEVAADPPHNNGCAQIVGVDGDLAHAAMPAALCNAQAACVAPAAWAVLEGRGYVIRSGLIHLLLCAVTVRFENDCYLWIRGLQSISDNKGNQVYRFSWWWLISHSVFYSLLS